MNPPHLSRQRKISMKRKKKSPENIWKKIKKKAGLTKMPTTFTEKMLTSEPVELVGTSNWSDLSWPAPQLVSYNKKLSNRTTNTSHLMAILLPS